MALKRKNYYCYDISVFKLVQNVVLPHSLAILPKS